MFAKTFFWGVFFFWSALLAGSFFVRAARKGAVLGAVSNSFSGSLRGKKASLFKIRSGRVEGSTSGRAFARKSGEWTGFDGVLAATASTNADQIASLTALASRLETDAASVNLTAVAQAFSAN